MKKRFEQKLLENTEIMETVEYDAFKLDTKNRPINEKKVFHFMDLFRKGKNFMNEFPAVVDEDFIVLDGQHRFEACKRLGIKFCFKRSDKLTIDNVQDVQLNAGWNVKDFLHSGVKQGNMNYIILQRFINKYQFPASIAAGLLGSKSGSRRQTSLDKLGFYNYTFQVLSEPYAHNIAEKVIDFHRAGFSAAKGYRFIHALAMAMEHPKYNHKQMMEKMANFGASLLKPQISVELFARNLEDLYNYHQPKDTHLRFDEI